MPVAHAEAVAARLPLKVVQCVPVPDASVCSDDTSIEAWDAAMLAYGSRLLRATNTRRARVALALYLLHVFPVWEDPASPARIADQFIAQLAVQ